VGIAGGAVCEPRLGSFDLVLQQIGSNVRGIDQYDRPTDPTMQARMLRGSELTRNGRKRAGRDDDPRCNSKRADWRRLKMDCKKTYRALQGTPRGSSWVEVEASWTVGLQTST